VDFVAEKDGNTFYLQVAYLLTSPETAEREFPASKSLSENSQRFIFYDKPCMISISIASFDEKILLS
jgi:predicted AAA+ superfamily ATPase